MANHKSPTVGLTHGAPGYKGTQANEHTSTKLQNKIPTSRMPVLLSMHSKNEYLRLAVMTFSRLLEGPSKHTCKRAHKHQTSKKWELYVEGADDMINYKVHHLAHLIGNPPCRSTANAHTSTKPKSALHYTHTTHIPLRHGPEGRIAECMVRRDMHGLAERTNRTAKSARRRTKYTSYHTMLSHSSKRSGQCIYANEHSPCPQMLTAQQKADLDKQIAKTQKDMGKARAASQGGDHSPTCRI